jgi:hypothetical protein
MLSPHITTALVAERRTRLRQTASEDRLVRPDRAMNRVTDGTGRDRPRLTVPRRWLASFVRRDRCDDRRGRLATES